MSVMNSSDIYSYEDHLRQLLDQRTARADVHGRFPSLSEFSDSPSVYSRPYFSPRPTGTPREPHPGTFEFILPPRGPPSQPRSPMSDRERLNLPNASSLDLDDDSQCSSTDPSQEDEISPIGSQEEVSRISTYGPKMTVHSRAPWELDEDDASDPDEPGASGTSNKRPAKKDSNKKVWGLGKSSSERQSEKRPSTDSNRSQSKPKPSMDSYTSNSSALLALAQASMSSTSLAISSPQPTLRDKLSLSRLRSRTPSHPNAAPLQPIETRPHPFPLQSSTNASPVSRNVRTASPAPVLPIDPNLDQTSSRSPTPSSNGEYTHPYANPDLVRHVVDQHRSISPKASVFPGLPSPTSGVNRSDSNATLTGSTASSSMFQSRSNTTVSSLTPVTSLSSVDVGPKDTSLLTARGKGISTPMLVNKPSLSSLSMMNGVGTDPFSAHPTTSPRLRPSDNKLVNNPAFMNNLEESPAGSSIKLISLEEAQAQARARSRSATVNPAISSNHTLPRSQLDSSDQDFESGSTGTRMRSASTGGKTRPEFSQPPPIPGHSSVSQKSVTRKKSGFMRLFNAKERERGLQSPPPPVPSLASELSSSASHTSSSQPARQRKGSAHRVPVPSLSPSLLDSDVSPNGGGSGSSSDSHGSPATRESQVSRERQLSARRNAPGLSIVTSSSMANTPKLAPPHSAVSDSIAPHGHTITITPTASASFSSVTSRTLPPSSAPPTSSEFVGLSLRPVSTLFSNPFGDQLVSPGAMESDTGTPTTAATAISPLSAEFPLELKACPCPTDNKTSPLISQDDQPSIIEALQDQILVARRNWQRQIWELEGQVRDLKAEVDELRMAENTASYCSACGRGIVGRPGADSSGCVDDLKKAGVKVGVVNRPRARTGVGSRFASGT